MVSSLRVFWFGRCLIIRSIIPGVFFFEGVVEFKSLMCVATLGRNGPGLAENFCSYVSARSSDLLLAENVKPFRPISGQVAGDLLRRLLFSL